MQNILQLLAFAPTPSERRPGRFLLVVAEWRHRSHSRRQLATLNDRELADIGLSRAEQWAECRKPFWQA